MKRRARLFFEEAEEAYAKGRFDFAVSFVEQAMQLLIKYLLAKLVGDYPKTHKLSLLSDPSRVMGERIERFVRENERMLSIVELACTGARYLDYSYSETIARDSLEHFRGSLEVVKCEVN